MKTEYLIPIDTQNGIAKTEQAFNYLLMSNANLKITGETVKFREASFRYKLQSNPIQKSDIVCYHLTVENSVDKSEFNPNDQDMKVYLDMLKNIKSTVLKYTDSFEILWDDVSFCCSQKAYPQIYEIENLMRKLLTKFMLVNVGTKWEKENTPSKIGKSKNQDKEINVGNSLLYRLDFIELSTFLFEPYAIKSTIEDLKQYSNTNDTQIFSILDQYIPKSNWARYFSNVISAEDEHIRKEWDELYKLRCKIAHNNLFTIDDLRRVESLIKDIKPSIELAIKELDKINVSDSDKEIISENLARNANEELGIFIGTYNNLFNILLNKYWRNEGSAEKIARQIPHRKLLDELLRSGIIDDVQAKKLQYIIYKRNHLVHGVDEISKEEMNKLIQEIMKYISMYEDMEIEGRDKYENGKTVSDSMQ